MKLHFWQFFKLFPSSKIDFWPFLKFQKMEFGQEKISWTWFIWFHEFFLAWTFFNFLAHYESTYAYHLVGFNGWAEPVNDVTARKTLMRKSGSNHLIRKKTMQMPCPNGDSNSTPVGFGWIHNGTKQHINPVSSKTTRLL